MSWDNSNQLYCPPFEGNNYRLHWAWFWHACIRNGRKIGKQCTTCGSFNYIWRPDWTFNKTCLETHAVVKSKCPQSGDGAHLINSGAHTTALMPVCQSLMPNNSMTWCPSSGRSSRQLCRQQLLIVLLLRIEPGLVTNIIFQTDHIWII